MATAEAANPTLPAWRQPWQTGGLRTIVREPRLLLIFMRAEMRDRYQGTLLGNAWDYMRPLTRFFVYYIVIGVLLGVTKSVPNFGIYIFSGVVVVQVFVSAVQSGTKSLSRNSGLIRRVNVPRQVFPLASVLAAFVRQRPSVIILVIAAVIAGWRPNHLSALPYLIGGLTMLALFVSGVTMITSVVNMYVRDTQYAIETLVLLARWASPVVYPWSLVPQRFGLHSLITTIYFSNPVTVALSAVRTAVWEPTVNQSQWHALQTSASGAGRVPVMPLLPLILSVVITLATFGAGLWMIHRTEHRVASRVS
jgi:ABC-2 type transport system permease protein